MKRLVRVYTDVGFDLATIIFSTQISATKFLKGKTSNDETYFHTFCNFIN